MHVYYDYVLLHVILSIISFDFNGKYISMAHFHINLVSKCKTSNDELLLLFYFS